MDLKENLIQMREIFSGAEGINYAYLFGSALKRMLPDSDIDILVNGDLDFDQRTHLAMKLTLRLKRNIDIILAKEASCELVLNALSQGLPILVKSRYFVEQDYFKNYMLYDANTSLRRIRFERIKKKYSND